MPGDEYEAAQAGFVRDLNQAFRDALPPTYAQLEQKSEDLYTRGTPGVEVVLARATTNEILQGRRQQPPRWRWVLTFITVLQAIARDSGLSAGKIGSAEEWRRKHDAVYAAGLAARRPVSVGRHRKPARQADAGGTDPAPLSAAPGRAAMVPPQSPAPARQAGSPRWWDGYRDITQPWLRSYLGLESASSQVRIYEPRFVPGLLQAEPYARARLAGNHPQDREPAVTRRVELRMRRQGFLRKPGFRLWAIMEESALRTRQVDVAAMRLQIAHLVNLSEQPNITLQVVRPAREPGLRDNVAIQEPITHFRFPDPDSGDVIFIERPPEGVLLRGRKEIDHYSQLISRLGLRAVRPGNVRDLLCEIFSDLGRN